MALSTGNKAIWSDVQALYNTLRAIQSRHGLTQSAVPSNPGLIKPASVTDLRSLVIALYNERHLSGSITTSNPANPTTGTLIKPAPLVTLQTELNRLNGICHNDSGNFGFGFSSNDGFGFSSNAGFSFTTNAGFSFSGNRGFSFSGDQSFSFSGNRGFSFSGDRGFSFASNASFSFCTGNNGFGFGSNEGFGFTALNFGGGNSSVRSNFCTRNFTFR